MRIPDVIKKSVVFLGLREGGEYVPRGTGFIVAVESTQVSGRVYHYLVTALHIVDAINGRAAFARLNSVNGEAIEVPLGENPDWIFHPSDGETDALWVDAVALPWNLSIDQFDFQALPSSMFVTEDQFAAFYKERPGDEQGKGTFGDGDETFIVGLFTKLAGKKTNLPIVRSGSVAMLPTEPVPVKRYADPASRLMVDMAAYLVEARSIGGLSGSPVFIVPPPGFFGYSGTSQFLLGLVHGHWTLPLGAAQAVAENFDADDAESATARLNTGVAIVVPAQSILEVLNQPEAVKARAKEDERRDADNLPEPDTAFSGDDASNSGEAFTHVDF